MRRYVIALSLAVMLPLPALAAEVIVKSGETLSEIAERHNIPLSRLLKLNGISDPDLVEVGRKLVLPSTAAPRRTAAAGSPSNAASVTVKQGETLSLIAARHDVPVSQLIKLNRITDPDQLKVGSKLLLKGASPSPKQAFTYNRKATEHVIRPGESLTSIAKGYDVPLQQLVAINAIADPNAVKAGTKLRLKGQPATPVAKPAAAATPAAKTVAASTPKPVAKPAAKPAAQAATASPAPTVATASPTASPTASAPAAPEWRTYGPLKVDWANWQPMGGSLVAPTLNDLDQSLYLAVNCKARKINATGKDGQWQSWEEPKASFETKLLSDLCTS